MNNRFHRCEYWIMIVLTSSILFGCTKYLPDNTDAFANDSRFTQTVYQPILGRNNLFANNFNAGSSTQPLDFEIVNLRRTADGSPAPELTNNYPVKIWTQAYTGSEKTIAEIDSKRTIQNQPLFSVRKHNGEFLMWAGAQSGIVRAQPDSGYVFDVKVSNTGGSKYFRNLRLIPQRERAYEPSNYDPVNGIAANSYVNPLSINNVIGQNTKLDIPLKDVRIFFYKNPNATTTGGKTLTFRFYDAGFNVIDPNKFNQTIWATLVHGFNMEKTSAYVKYDVAYPIPLVTFQTPYTNVAGTQAHTVFSYDRLNSGGFRESSSIVFDFAIYEEGNWEIIMVFSGDTPLFN